jgi:hypothetical protein
MSRCCQFSEDRKDPSAGRSRSATDKLGDIARAALVIGTGDTLGHRIFFASGPAFDACSGREGGRIVSRRHARTGHISAKTAIEPRMTRI